MFIQLHDLTGGRARTVNTDNISEIFDELTHSTIRLIDGTRISVKETHAALSGALGSEKVVTILRGEPNAKATNRS